MRKALRGVRAFMRDVRGLETTEYAVVTALIVGGIVVALVALGAAMTDRFGSVTTII